MTTTTTVTAVDAITLVAQRLSDPAEIARIAARPDNVEPIYGAAMWEPMALSHGYPGTALLYAELARTDDAWAPVLHAHLSAAMAEMPKHPSNGLFFGPAAVAFAALSGAGPRGRYGKLRERLLSWVADDQLNRLAAHTERAERGGLGVSWGAYDVINGLSGTGRLLLAAVEEGSATLEIEAALTATLNHLVRVSRPITVDGIEVPGWWIPPELQPVEEDRIDYPRGDFNLGLAHGVPGPLMLLALSHRRGWTVPGQAEAIDTMARWLTGWTMTDEAGVYWPCRVGFDDQTGEARPRDGFTRNAWCYGAPGVATALDQAGAALGEESWRRLAVRSLRDSLGRDEAAWRLDGPTVCHGYAGLLQVLWRLGNAHGDAELLGAANRMAGRVLDFLDPNAPFAFQHLTPDSRHGWKNATTHRHLDVAGVLEGAAGVACALLSFIAPRGSAAGAWDRVLMLS